jgi:5-methylcytosine-specific restriction endonuclease McrA
MQTSAHASDVVTQLVPGGSANLAHLSDVELLSNTRILVGKSNQVFAALLAHLAEVDARGLHRTRACASLYTYCIYELRFSEDAAARRAGAAKLVKRFPILLDAIANGELHLTGLLMLGPHLTAENVVGVLGRAKFRTKKELAKLVRELHPLPLVPDSVEPLGIGLKPLRRPTWEQYVTSLAPPVRELPPGERPRDWANDTTEEGLSLMIDAGLSQARGAQQGPAVGEAVHRQHVEGQHVEGQQVEGQHVEGQQVEGQHVEGQHVEGQHVEGQHVEGQHVDGPHMAGWPVHGQLVEGSRVEESPQQTVSLTSALPAPARVDVWQPPPRPLAPQQYQMQFTTSEEHVQLVERAKALLARSAPGKSLGELHLQAMKLLVAELEKKKFAVTARPRGQATRGKPTSVERERGGVGDVERGRASKGNGEREGNGECKSDSDREQFRRDETIDGARGHDGELGARRRSRHVPAAVRRSVFERDGGCCTFVDERGVRCRETRGLELHHRQPFGKQGTHSASNVTLYCQAHNALAAERDFGAPHMARHREALRHETLASELRAANHPARETEWPR